MKDHNNGAKLGDYLVDVAIALLGVCAFFGAGFINWLEVAP